jgi:hypothetical protein
MMNPGPGWQRPPEQPLRHARTQSIGLPIQIKQLTVTSDWWRVTGKAERKMNHGFTRMDTDFSTAKPR